MAPRRILCVDDESLNLAFLEALLAPRGYEFIGASNGHAALKILADRGADLVFLDVMMPGMDGFGLCRMIKGQERTRHIPVILLTALSGQEDKIRGIEAGADDFITKPFDKAEVLARIQVLLKVKSLDDRLKGAYEDIIRMIDTAGHFIRSFDPVAFNFASSVDAFIEPILRPGKEAREKPSAAVVGLPQESGEWTWRKYQASQGELSKSEVLLRFPADVAVAGEPRTLFYNKDELEGPRAAWVAEALAPVFGRPSSVVCWLGSDLRVFLLDYGREVTAYDVAVLDGLVTQSLFLRSLAKQVGETEHAFAYTVAALARAAEANDEDTGSHIQRVGEYCAVIANGLGLPEEYTRAIRLQAQTHDVGKIHVHPDILKKAGDLTETEWAEMRKHTLYGALILGEHPRLKMARNMALAHHEKWDGSGYPFGLKREEIALEARIIGIADQYDALRSKRLYKPSLDHETAVSILTKNGDRTSPGHFDPAVLKVFKATHEEFAGIFSRIST